MSTSPQANTKIEMVTEAIEGLVLASVRLATDFPRNAADNFTADIKAQQAAHQTVADSREFLGRALRDFLQPTLRAVTGDGRPVHSARPPIDVRNLLKKID